VRSQAQTVVDAQVGCEVARDWRLRMDIFNLFNSQTNDVAYFYESRLPGEPNGVEDVHFHPNEPRSVHLSLSYRF
jgi:outer membrane receptor protein involved in Fe transport